MNVEQRVEQALRKARMSKAQVARDADVPAGWFRAFAKGHINKGDTERIRRVSEVLGLNYREMLALTNQLDKVEAASAAREGVSSPVPTADLAALVSSNEAVVKAVASQTEALERVWRSNDRQAKAIEDLASAIRSQQAVTPEQATRLTHSLAEAIGKAMRGLAIVPQPQGSPEPGEPSASDAPQQGRTSPDSGNSDPEDIRRRGRGR